MALPPNAASVFIDVTRNNLPAACQRLREGLARATFVAVDAEFTGLGHDRFAARGRDPTRSSNVEERYKALREVAGSFTMVALGVSIFERKDDPVTPATATYIVSNFNFSLLCQTPFRMCPGSLAFLAENGFDFNKHASYGIPFFPGNERTFDQKNQSDPCFVQSRMVRDLLDSIFYLKVPVVVHNGLMDLLFIYQSFHCELPETLSAFVADLADMFPGGLFDTKYVADYITRESTSFLAYLYRKYERLSFSRPKGYDAQDFKCLLPTPSPLASSSLQHASNSKTASSSSNKIFCEQYANHGYCALGKLGCPKSHDLDIILDVEWNLRSARATPAKSTNIAAKGGEEHAETPTKTKFEASVAIVATKSPLVTNASIKMAPPAILPDPEKPLSACAKKRRRRLLNKMNRANHKHEKIDQDNDDIETEIESSNTNQIDTTLSAQTTERPTEDPDSDIGDINTRKRPRSLTDVDDIVHDESAVVKEYSTSQPQAIITHDLPAPTAFHSAAFDSFMTGFVFAAQLARYGMVRAQKEFCNRVYLVGLDMPLRITASAFAKPSRGHLARKSSRSEKRDR